MLYFVSFLDLLGVSMIIPSLGSHVKAMDGGMYHISLHLRQAEYHQQARFSLVLLCRCTVWCNSFQLQLLEE